MNKLKIAALLTALIAVNSTAKPTSVRTPLKFYVDSEVLTEYSKDEVYDKISTLITHNNDALRNTGVQRTVSSIDFIRSKNSFKDPRIELHALLSKKENHAKVFDLFFEDEAVYDRINKRNIRSKPPAYTVFMGLPRGPIASCGAAPEPSKEYELTDKERIAVLAFDMHGECSFDWLLTHELGHIDGLGHVSNQCTDGSMNIMAPKADKSVRHDFTGAEDCPTNYATNHTKKYKELVPSLVKYTFRAKPLIFNKKEQPITFSNIRLSTDTSSSIALLFDVEHNLRTSKKIYPKISYIAYEKGKKVRKTHKLNPIQLSPRRKKQTVVADFVDNSLIQPFVAIENGEGSIMY